MQAFTFGQSKARLSNPKDGKQKVTFDDVAGVKEAKQELIAKNIKIGDYQVGIMIEIPAAAILADVFIKHVDFLSLGTNDLIQYTMAADRMQTAVSYLYQPLNPSIIRLIKMVGDAATKANKMAGVCGEMGGDLLATEILLGCGITSLSMSPNSIAKVRKLISTIDINKAKEKVLHMINMSTEKEVMEYVKNNK
jgi:phosphotransferase system enzyme I (PtsI)